MKKALRDHAPLPYANHITDILIKFNVPLEDEPFEEVNWGKVQLVLKLFIPLVF